MKNTTQKQNSRTKKQTGPREISWTAEVAHTRHRWWWYIVTAWIALASSLMVLAVQAWTVAAVIVFGAAALIVINVGHPRTWRVEITKKHISVSRPDADRFDYQLPLERYRSFTIVDMPRGRRDRWQRAIALLPVRRFGRPQLLVLPYDEHEADMIIQQVSDLIPYDPAESFSRFDRALERVGRWMGIS